MHQHAFDWLELASNWIKLHQTGIKLHQTGPSWHQAGANCIRLARTRIQVDQTASSWPKLHQTGPNWHQSALCLCSPHVMGQSRLPPWLVGCAPSPDFATRTPFFNVYNHLGCVSLIWIVPCFVIGVALGVFDLVGDGMFCMV